MNSLQLIAYVLNVIIFILIPFAIIWALNTLFPVLAIPYDIWNWLAIMILHLFFRARTSIQVLTQPQKG